MENGYSLKWRLGYNNNDLKVNNVFIELMIICHFSEPFLYLGLLFPWKLWRPVLAGAVRLKKKETCNISNGKQFGNMKHK